MSINPFSLHDLAGFFINASMALIFYVVYRTMGRRTLYLLFANLIALAAGSCLCTFLADNAVPAGTLARDAPETEARFLLWLRLLYLAATAYLPCMCHFVIRYCRVASIGTRQLLWLYGACVPLALAVWSPGFFAARGEPFCETSSWSCTMPWWPHPGIGYYLYVLVWLAVNLWAQALLWRYARQCGTTPGTPLARARLVQFGILVPACVALGEMVAVLYGYQGISYFPVSASVMGLLLATALGRDGMDQHQWSRALQDANHALTCEMAERERVEQERGRLDQQLEHLRYLYRLRTALGGARTTDAVFKAAGKAEQEALTHPAAGSVAFEYEGRVWRFGEDVSAEQIHYECALAWGGRERGQLRLSSRTPLSETQQRALVDETAGQVAQTLEARELEAQLLQSARLVSLGQLAAGLAHELSQPLTAIATTAGDVWLRLLGGMELSKERLQEMMADMRHLVGRMSATVEHLRAFSRDTSREAKFLFSINEPLLASLQLVRAQLKGHGVALHVEVAEPLPPVAGNPHRLEQVFLNLLANARDAIDEKAEQLAANAMAAGPWKGALILKTGEERDGQRWIVASVEDNGVGMDEHLRQRIFDPFFTTKPADRGSGLGLSIAYAIVRDHGGRLTCESRLGEGTRFRLALPVAEEA